MAPNDFLQIKQKIESSPILTDDEKKEWLYLLPKMKAEQIKELDRVLSLRIPATQNNLPPSPPLTQDGTKEDFIDLKSLDIPTLRKSSSVYAFLEKLSDHLKTLVRDRVKTPADVEKEFEQSPLYKSCLQAGVQIMSGAEPREISREDFEAISDFRESLKKIGK